jgi:broad specificity phosphatase PhoE
MIILLSRHGESEYNIENKIGGDSSLSENGIKYAKNLYEFCKNNDKIIPKTCIISTKKRTIETSNYLKNYMNSIDQYEELDEIDAGIAETLTYEEFESYFPIENKKRKENKLSYRYPQGESYIDLIKRTEKISEVILNKNKNVFIIAHRAVIRTLIYHFTKCDINTVPNIDIPLHKVLVLNNGNISLIDIN